MPEKPVLEERIKAALAPLIAEWKKEIYLPQYVNQTSDAQALGVIVAKFLQWAGNPIIETFLAALEDANYSTLETQIEELTGVHI